MAVAVLFCLFVTPLGAQERDGKAGDRVLAMAGKKVFTVRDLRPWVFEARLSDPMKARLTDEELNHLLLPMVIEDYLLGAWAELQVQQPPKEAVATRAQAVTRRFEELARGEDELKAKLEEAGIGAEQFRQWINDRAKQDLYIRDAITARTNLGGLDPLDATVENAIRIKLSHILVMYNGATRDARDAAMERALRIRRDIAAGLPFEKAARLYSDDKYSRENGGFLGWFEQSELDPDLWSAAVSVRPGDVPAPVEIRDGCHLLLVLDFQTKAQQEYARLMREEEGRQLRKLRNEMTVILAPGYELPPLTEEESKE